MREKKTVNSEKTVSSFIKKQSRTEKYIHGITCMRRIKEGDKISCKNCGAEVDRENDKFCWHCGKEILKNDMTAEQILKEVSGLLNELKDRTISKEISVEETYKAIDEIESMANGIEAELSDLEFPPDGFKLSAFEKAYAKIPAPMLKRFEREVFTKENLSAEDIERFIKLYLMTN